MAVKRIIGYKEKDYEVSTVYLENMYEFETMIFPIENGVVNGNEVYCFRTPDVSESYAKHVDIVNNVSKYVSKEAISEYLKSKEEETVEDTNYVYITKEYKEAIEHIMSCLEDGYVDLGLHDQDELMIIREAMRSLICVDQFRWERDVAIGQLEELGIGFGQKIDGVYLTKEEYEDMLEYMGQNK